MPILPSKISSHAFKKIFLLNRNKDFSLAKLANRINPIVLVEYCRCRFASFSLIDLINWGVE
eukprot:snap_masked-scaffold_3-processed-gene-21.57-mRNA-1 protein AED:1.00 eAED:1.00 QI:0/0/0/0/1/1/2/0/61